jgi:hypothetical protein
LIWFAEAREEHVAEKAAIADVLSDQYDNPAVGRRFSGVKQT